MSKGREQIINWLSEIDIKDKIVLDVGSGPRDKWAREHTKGKESRVYHTLDIDDDFNTTYTLDLNRKLEDGVSWVASPKYEHYDIVFCLETLEHVWNPIQAIQNIAGWIKKGGVLYFSTPFIQCIHDKWDMLRYTDQWYREVLPKFGLGVDYVKPRVATKGKSALKEFYKKEGIRMSKVTLRQGKRKQMYDTGYYGKAVKI